jgi:ribonuclease HII
MPELFADPVLDTPGPHLLLEGQYNGIVCGVDEVGRGALAGPVMAAAIILPPNFADHPVYPNITDSKKLSATARDEIFDCLTGGLAQVAIGQASVDEIDQINILNASMLAMARAVEELSPRPDLALIDGNHTPDLTCQSVPVVKGDQISTSIAAASILAKVTRDRLMHELADAYPHYGWQSNVGYGSATHLSALKTHGASPHHRRSFKPVNEVLTVNN